MSSTGKKLEELFPGLVRVAGPDDPIYQGGVVMNSITHAESTETERIVAQLLALMQRFHDSALTDIQASDVEE